MRTAIGTAACMTTMMLAGCGGEERTAADFREDLDAICMDLTQDADRITRPEPGATLAQLVPFLNRGVAVNEDAVERMEALDLPDADDDAELAERAIAASRSTTDTAAALAQAARAGSRARYDRLAKQLDEMVASTDELQREIGAESCIDDDGNG